MSAQQIVKTVIQYSYPLTNDERNFLNETGKVFNGARNYFYSRFSSVKSLIKITKFYDTRNSLMKENLKNLIKIPARYWKLALANVLNNFKTLLENIRLKIRKASKNNINLNEEDRHYINAVIKNVKYLKDVLMLKKQDNYLYEKFKVNFKKLNSLIRRYYRRYKGKVPYSIKNNFLILDSELYKYNKGEIKISTLTKGKRLTIKLKDKREFKGNLILKWDKKLAIYGTVKTPIEYKTILENPVAIDKGYNTLITTDSGRKYGTEYKFINAELIEKQVKKNSQRQRMFNHLKKLERKDNLEKIDNIKKYNLGRKKQNRLSNRIKERSKSYINRELKKFFKNEKPSEIIKEDLTWEKIGGKKRGKGFRAKISRWEKGYLDSQIEWKALQKNIKITNVNPAYTSQICHSCENFGNRNGEIFECEHCNTKYDADVNAAHNIKLRKDIKKITLYTSAANVKTYYENLKKL